MKDDIWSFVKAHPIITFLIVDTVVCNAVTAIRILKEA